MFRLLKAAGCLLAVSAFVLAAAYSLGTAMAGAAPGLRSAAPLARANRDDPVVVTKITRGNAVVQKGLFAKPAKEARDPVTPFQAGDDWIESLTVYLLNRTEKPIVHALITFSFPEVPPVFELELGRIPAGFEFDARSGRPIEGGTLRSRTGSPPPSPFWFGPKQVLAIHLSDYIGQIRASVEPQARRPLSSLTQMHVYFDYFDFEDGLRRNGPVYQVMDPGTHSWHTMDRSYFPGNMELYWPGQPGWVEPW